MCVCTIYSASMKQLMQLCQYNNPLYVVDLRWVNIQSAEEASKVLRVGNKNRSAAATKMNQSSSRR